MIRWGYKSTNRVERKGNPNKDRTALIAIGTSLRSCTILKKRRNRETKIETETERGILVIIFILNRSYTDVYAYEKQNSYNNLTASIEFGN